MSAVDPKPTYTLSEQSSLLALALACKKKKDRELIIKVSGLDVKTLEMLDLKSSIQSHHIFEESYTSVEMQDEIDITHDIVASNEYSMTNALNSDGVSSIAWSLARFIEDASDVVIGSHAMFRVVNDIVVRESGGSHVPPAEIGTAAQLASELTLLSAIVCKMHPSAVNASCQNLHRAILLKATDEWHAREIAEDIAYHTVSKRVRSALVAATMKRQGRLTRRLYPDGVTDAAVMQRITGSIRRDSDVASSIDYIFMGAIRAIKRNGVVYIMNTDNIRKVYQLAHRRAMAVASCALQGVIMPAGSVVDHRTCSRLTNMLIESASYLGDRGLPMSWAGRCMHQVWCAMFAKAYDEKDKDYWSPHYDAIMASASSFHFNARKYEKIAGTLTQSAALDALRLHHILPAPDTPADLLWNLTAAIPDQARKPNSQSWSEFMRFVKSYELCMFLYKNRKAPNLGGNRDAIDKDCYRKCLRGRFSLPPAESLGEVYIHQHYPYVLYADQFALRAKDATRIPYDLQAVLNYKKEYEQYSHNELLHALKHGNNLGLPLNLDITEARKQFWSANHDRHVICDVAAKAESIKSDCKPRGTFSANGEFRHIQGEFDRNCQVINDLIGCGSLRADPTNHAKGMAKVAKGTALGHMSTSHDIEAWSPSQDRDCFREFGMYRASIFRGIDPNGWAHAWRCFDVVVSRNGCRKWAHQTNGGYQGFPGTMDTSLHVEILLYFLWKMRAKGRIPRDVVTLAKATIDDCLAQMGTWIGTPLDLENELRDHYLLMGYSIDPVKSIISRCKAIYLNQASINGGNVPQGLKVMLKVDRPLEVVLSTPFEDFMACTAGAKAAIQVGHDSLSAYFLAATIGITYMLRAGSKIALMGPEKFAMAAALPRGDGGFGLPLLPDLLAKEHPDARAHCNHAIMMYALGKEMSGKDIGKDACSLWAGVKSTGWALSSKTSIFFNPRSCTRSGVPSVETVKRAAVIDAAKLWAKADVFTNALSNADHEDIKGIYESMMASAESSIDVPFLEAYTAHLPDNVLDALVGKVTSYRVAKEIMGQREVVTAQAKISSRFRALVSNLLDKKFPPGISHQGVLIDMKSISGYRRTEFEREEYYSVNDVRLSAHTVPSPFEVISVMGTTDKDDNGAHISSDTQSLRLWATDAPGGSRDLVSSHGVAYPFKSENWVAESADEFRYMDSVCTMFVEGCAILTWAESAGMDIRVWREMYMFRWTGDHSLSPSDYVTKSLQGSIKRSSSAFGSRYHPIFVNVNIQRSVMVNVAPLLALLSAGSYDIDPVSVIATCYTIGTINMAYIVDSFRTVGQSAPDFHWKIGLNPELYKETRHLDILVHTKMSHVLAVFEDSAASTSFLENSGGTAAMLEILLKPGGLARLIFASPDPDSDNMLPDDLDLAPMVSIPAEAPTAALFISARPAHREKGQLVTDIHSIRGMDRLVEISPSSAKLCAVSALEQSVIPRNLVSAYRMGDTDALDRETIMAEVDRIIRHTMKMITSNIPTEKPLHAMTASLRACGLRVVRSDDENSQSVENVIRRAQEAYALDPHDLVIALQSYGYEYHGYSDFKPSHKRVRISKDPEKSNAAERIKQIKMKYKIRAKEYHLRLSRIKEGVSVYPRDKKGSADEQARKVAYLSGAKTYMECLQIDKQINDEETWARVISRCKSKIASLAKAAVDDSEYPSTFEGVVAVNNSHTGKGWYPDEYCRGVSRAAAWAVDDWDSEQHAVYFVPRMVTIRTKIAAHRLTAMRPKRSLEQRKPSVTQQSQQTHVDASPAQQDDNATAPSGQRQKRKIPSLASILRRARTPKSDYDTFVARLAIWQCYTLFSRLTDDLPTLSDQEAQRKLLLYGHRLNDNDISHDDASIIREFTSQHMHEHQERLIAPDADESYGPTDSMAI